MAPTPDDAPRPGGTLAHYTLLERLGAGGMGEVWRVRDEALQREVALKLPAGPALAEPEARAALVREARTASALNHPNLCTVHEVGEAGGRVYVAMELVPGRTLKDAIPAGGLDDATVLRWAAPLARALAHAHARGVIHRDLKSRNVVVTPEGTAKLLDFGLARPAVPDPEGRSEPGTVTGTVEYLAPELLRGGRADERSDLWAFGVLLHEMCAGALPFGGPTMAAVLSAILQSAPAELPAHTSPGLRAVVARCLAKDPRQRYRSTDEVAAALEALLGAAPPPRRAGRRRTLVAIAVVAAIAGALAWPALERLRPRGPAPATPVRTLAVLPLADRSAEGARDWFAEGMTDQLVADLAQLRSLRVLSRASAAALQRSDRPLPEAARALGVDAVIEGSVQQDGDMVRIRARLVDARDERQLWAGQFDRRRRDVLALQSEVAQEVTEEVRARLTGGERARLARAPEVDPVAFEHYLRGRWALAHAGSGEAIAEFRAALAADPAYARAWAGLAHALVRAHTVGDSVAAAVHQPALQAAARAVDADGESAEAWLAMANAQATLAWDLAGAHRSATRAVALAPGDAEAHHTLGLLEGALGRLDACVTELDRARERDPVQPYYHQQAGEVRIYARRFAEAAADLRGTVALFPDFAPARRDLGWALLEDGHAAEAVAVLDSLPAPDPMQVRALARAGRAAAARALLARLERPGAHAAPSDLAAAHAELGEEDAAFRLLARARDERDRGFLTLPYDPAFDRLRKDPRFAALAAALPQGEPAGGAAER